MNAGACNSRCTYAPLPDEGGGGGIDPGLNDGGGSLGCDAIEQFFGRCLADVCDGQTGNAWQCSIAQECYRMRIQTQSLGDDWHLACGGDGSGGDSGGSGGNGGGNTDNNGTLPPDRNGTLPPDTNRTIPDTNNTVPPQGQQDVIAGLEAYGNFISGGVTLELKTLNNKETAKLFVGAGGSGSYKEATPFVRFDASHLASSLFNLNGNTNYDVKVQVFDANGNFLDEETASLKTKPEWSLPNAQRTVVVSNDAELASALSGLQAGDRVLLRPGTYTGFSVSGKVFSGSGRAVIMSYDLLDRALIKGNVNVSRSSYITIYGLNVESAGPVSIRGGNYIEVVGNRLTDYAGAPEGEALIFIQHSDESPLGRTIGGNLVMGNLIADLDHGPFLNVAGAERQTYYGIKQNYTVGGYTTFRNNLITGVADGIAPGGDEGMSPLVGLKDDDVLNTWPNREMDIYDNIIHTVSDDAIEMDGHTANARIFNNLIANAVNPMTFAPAYPGPYFAVRNHANAYIESAVKLNTNVNGETRNVLYFHNSFKKGTSDWWTNSAIYFDIAARNRDVTLRSNIIEAIGDDQLIGAWTPTNSPCERYHMNHDYDNDLWWTPRTANILRWAYAGEQSMQCFNTFAQFQAWTAHPTTPTDRLWSRCSVAPPTNPPLQFDCPDQRIIPQEPNGFFAEPQMSEIPVPGFPAGSGVAFMVPDSGSPAINTGIAMPGITDSFSGSAPDIGAFERGLDSQAPSVPSLPEAKAVASTRVALKWGASIDNQRVLGYVVYRNGSAIGFSTGTYFLDTGLGGGSDLVYAVSAYDIYGNESAKSPSASASTVSNTPPSLTSIGNQGIYEGQTLNLQLSASDPDIDDKLTYSVSGAPSGSSFDVNSGLFSWTPSTTSAGTYPMAFSVADSSGGTDSENIVVTVLAVDESKLVKVKLQYGQPVPEWGISNYTGMKDASLNSDYANAGYYERGSADAMGYRHLADAGIYWFDVSNLPANAKVIDAHLQLSSVSASFDEAGGLPIFLAQTLPPNDSITWVEGSGTGYYDQYGGTSWLKKDNVSGSQPRYPWSNLAGEFGTGDLASTYSGAAVAQMRLEKPVGDYNSGNLAAAIQQIIGAGNRYEGFVIERRAASGSVRKDAMAAKEFSDITKRPALYIAYEGP